MPRYTAKPDDLYPDYLDYFGGAADEIAAVTDGSDTTYVKAHATDRSIFRYNAESLGAGERIVSVCPYARHSCTGTKNVNVAVSCPPSYTSGVALIIAPNVAIANYELAAHQGALLNYSLNEEWDPASGYGSSVQDPHTADANRAKFYELGLYLYAYKPATVAAPSAPSGTVTTTQRPTCTATVSSIVESWQVPSGVQPFCCDVDTEFRIYHEADIGTLTSPPESATPVWQKTERRTISQYIDGVTASTLAVSATPDVSLGNGSYVVFVRTSRVHPAGTAAWSAWAHTHFTVDIAVPTTPTLTLTKDDATQGVTVKVKAITTAGYTAGSYCVFVERKFAGGTWLPVRGMQDVPVVEGTETIVGVDYEAQRGAENGYRAKVTALLTADSTVIESAWAAAAVTGPAAVGWNLKALEDTDRNWIGVHVLREFSESSQREHAVFAPLYRERPVVVSGFTGGVGGSLSILASGATDIAKLEAFADYRGLVLLETAFGEQRHIQPTNWSWSRIGTVEAPLHRASLEYVHVETDTELLVSGMIPNPLFHLNAARAASGVGVGSNDLPTSQWYDLSAGGHHGTLTNFAYEPGDRPRSNTETDKAVWHDLSGEGNDGTLTGFAYDETSGWAGDGSAANPYHLYFDLASKLQVAKTAEFSTAAVFGGSWTVDLWFLTGTTGYGYELLNGVYHLPRIYLSAALTVAVAWKDAAGTHRDMATTSALPQNSLVHVAAVKDAVNHLVRIYANNALVSGATTWYDMQAAEPGAYDIMCYENPASTKRKLLAFRVYKDTVFDAAEVAQNPAAGPTGWGYVRDGLVLDLNAARAVRASGWVER